MNEVKVKRGSSLTIIMIMMTIIRRIALTNSRLRFEGRGLGDKTKTAGLLPTVGALEGVVGV